MSPRPAERGSITAFVAVVATALVLVAGMAYDGGAVLRAHAAARRDANQAARAGAQQLDTDHLRSTGELRLDPSSASEAAQAYLAAAGVTGTVTVTGDEITVTVTVTQDLLILPGPDRTITATQSAIATDGLSP